MSNVTKTLLCKLYYEIPERLSTLPLTKSHVMKIWINNNGRPHTSANTGRLKDESD